MRKLLLVVVLAATGLLATAAPAVADDFECNGVFAGATFDNVVVPENGACTLVGSTVRGNVKVLTNAYFEANATRVIGNVEGDRALTIFVHEGSQVGGNVQGDKTAQVFLFDSDVAGNAEAKESIEDFGAAQVCGMSIGGNVEVQKMGTDVLVGDPLALDCAGNTVEGNIKVEENFTDVELTIRGNTVRGNLEVFKNEGPSDKAVQSNTGGEKLTCKENSPPFVGSPNPGFQEYEGQCPS
jgi:hypothetical protein